MSLRIAFDLDGVLADMDRAVSRQAEALFKQPPRETTADDAAEAQTDAGAEGQPDAPPLPARLALGPRQQKALWRHLRSVENFWEGLEEIEAGTVARLAEAAAEREWEVIFLTSRPATSGLTAQRQTQRWLTSKGFAHPSVFVVTTSRGRIAAALELDVVIDDRMENCMDVVADSQARAILVCRAEMRSRAASARRLGIGVVESTRECLDLLTRAGAGKAGGDGGPVDRLMRFLGLKEP